MIKLASTPARFPRTLRLQFNGTIPSGYTSITTLTVSYNPYIVGNYLTGKTPSTANCGAAYAGSSIGLDRSFVDILDAARPVLDPVGYVLAPGGWNKTASLQPCPNFAGQVNPQRINYGGGWIGVVCDTTMTVGGPNTLNLMRWPAGNLPFRLTGSLPGVLRELRTLKSLNLMTNALRGENGISIPLNASVSFCLIARVSAGRSA